MSGRRPRPSLTGPCAASTRFTWPRRLQFGAQLEAFVTYDARLLAAARQSGLPVASPGAATAAV